MDVPRCSLHCGNNHQPCGMVQGGAGNPAVSTRLRSVAWDDAKMPRRIIEDSLARLAMHGRPVPSLHPSFSDTSSMVGSESSEEPEPPQAPDLGDESDAVQEPQLAEPATLPKGKDSRPRKREYSHCCRLRYSECLQVVDPYGQFETWSGLRCGGFPAGSNACSCIGLRLLVPVVVHVYSPCFSAYAISLSMTSVFKEVESTKAPWSTSRRFELILREQTNEKLTIGQVCDGT